jgi:ATP-dependent Clp protease protease subunit
LKKFWKFIKNAATETTPGSIELRIQGDIVSDDETWLYEFLGMNAVSPNVFREELKQYAGKDITVWIDSYGGDVFAAAGIYNALKEHRGKVTVKIDSKAMSAASVIAMAGDEVLMSPVAIMMIHNPLTMAEGDMHDLRKAADILDAVKETLINAYALKTGRSRSKISSMMDDETWMSANVAVNEGFADGILYDNNKADDIMNFAFDRFAIVNSARNTSRQILSLDRFKVKNGVSPDDVSRELAPEDQEWQKPTLSDFTDKSWNELTDQEKKDIAGHYAWAAEMPPAIFGDLKFPHHDPKSHKVVWQGIVQCAARLNQADVSEADISKIKNHLASHYKQFGRTPPWEQDSSNNKGETELLKAKLALELEL